MLWRSFLLIAVLMLAAVAAWVGIFQRAQMESRAQQTAQMLASVVNLTSSALLAAHPDRRAGLLAALSDIEGVHVYLAASDDTIEPPPLPLVRRVEELLSERLGADTQIAFAVNGEQGLFVRFRIFAGPEGSYWLALPRERLERQLPWLWLGWGALVLLLALAGAWLVVYRIVRPLEKERAMLLAGISHDLRTPLARLRMETELSVVDAAARAGMEADIAEMDRTIGQFLDFARPVEKTPATPIDVAALLSEVAARYGERLLLRQQTGTAVLIRLRQEALRRAVVNLVENALRHGGAQAVELELTHAGRKVVIAVLDRGPGIAPTASERFKQPFTRGEAARTGAGGAGLGLAIVERIVRSAGGRLELLPREGGGLAARIVLPTSL